MACGVQHDAYAFRVTVWRLPRCFRTTALKRRGNSRLDVVDLDLDLEVEHLRLLAGPLRPRRRLVPVLALDVEVYAPRGVPQLCPARWFEVAYLEPEEAFVEASYWSGVRAVDLR